MDFKKKWKRPVCRDFPLGTPFGVPGEHWKSGFHTGDDFKCPRKTPVQAADNGKVTWIGDSGDGFGNCIRVEHSDGTKSYYCHLDEIYVELDQMVMKGQIIAASGNTGNVHPAPTPENPDAGAHLHFGVKFDGKWFKPEYEEVV